MIEVIIAVLAGAALTEWRWRRWRRNLPVIAIGSHHGFPARRFYARVES